MERTSGFEAFNAQVDGLSQHLNRLRGLGGADGAADKVATQLGEVRKMVEDRTLERMLDVVADLDEEQLYAEIERAEEALRNQLRSRREAQDTLRAEVERLRIELQRLQENTGAYVTEAESIHEQQDKLAIHRHEEFNAAKRQLELCKRNTGFANKILADAENHAESVTKFFEEAKFHEMRAAEQRERWEDAVEEVDKVAKRVQSLEAEKARLVGEVDAIEQADATAFVDIRKVNLEVKSMVSEQRALQKELRRAEDAQELQKLMENERAANNKKRMTTSVLIQQIAELEESGDQIERHSQALIEELRIVLERGASQIREFEHSKRQADEWVKAMWSTICQQKREQLLLHQRMKEEDSWTQHLQERTDTLVEELRTLEEKVKDYEGPVGASAQEKKLEEEMFQQLAKIREKRRGTQHILAINLARRKPLEEALADAQEDEKQLMTRLAPLRKMMGQI